jgi:hypothetical protein
MRACLFALFPAPAVVLPNSGNAEVYQFRSGGVWLEFNGARCYADSPATTFSPHRFAPLGDCLGFPAYRENTAERMRSGSPS